MEEGEAIAAEKHAEIGEKDRVDVILTNPPFGGEEEKGIQGNFPDDRQTAETALLFLQLIMRKLHRNPTRADRPARAAVVVPNGTLYGDGVCARIKEELLKNFNLHTIVRLPTGVFAPYTNIPTNIFVAWLLFTRLNRADPGFTTRNLRLTLWQSQINVNYETGIGHFPGPPSFGLSMKRSVLEPDVQ
jgi:hypothetical protein